MSQAETKFTETPRNPFVDTDLRDTLSMCSQVVGFVADALPAIENNGIELGRDGSHGASWILEGVREALDYAKAQENAKRAVDGCAHAPSTEGDA